MFVGMRHAASGVNLITTPHLFGRAVQSYIFAASPTQPLHSFSAEGAVFVRGGWTWPRRGPIIRIVHLTNLDIPPLSLHINVLLCGFSILNWRDFGTQILAVASLPTDATD